MNQLSIGMNFVMPTEMNTFDWLMLEMKVLNQYVNKQVYFDKQQHCDNDPP